MSRHFACPCGAVFTPAVFEDSIQLLCDDCAVSHYLGHGEIASCWVGKTNVISLFRSATGGPHRPAAEGIVSGLARGEVGEVTPVPLFGPFAPGARRG